MNSSPYQIDGCRVPRVTTILRDSMRGWDADQWYLDRGTAVHACAAMIARGQEFGCDIQIAGQVAAVRRFFAEVNPEVLAVEQAVVSRRHRYGGTLDLLCRINGRLTVVDWKASAGPSAPYQLAAYALAWAEGENDSSAILGRIVVLSASGRYHMSEAYELRLLRAGWLALLAVYRIRREAGIREKDDAG